MITHEQTACFDAKLRDALRVRIAPTALDPKIEHTENLTGATRSLVTYNVDNDERVGAYLLMPDPPQAQPLPAILAIHQHAGEFHLGKSEPAGRGGKPEFHYGLELARRGYAVLCPDLLAFEDRVPPTQRGDSDKQAGMWNERFEATRLLLQGSCLQSKYVQDLSVSIDYLESLDIVDKARIGCIGHSLGGQETLWLTWFDKRIRAAVSNCGFAMLSAIIRDRINHNMAAYVPGLLELGDLDTLLCAIAPRPFFFSAGASDAIFPIDGVRHIAKSAGQYYAESGAPHALKCVIFDGGHGFPDEAKQQAYAFLDTHL